MKAIWLRIFAPSDSLKLLCFVSEVLSQMYWFTDCGQSLEGRAVGQRFALKVTSGAALGKRDAWWIVHSAPRLLLRNEGWESGCAGFVCRGGK